MRIILLLLALLSLSLQLTGQDMSIDPSSVGLLSPTQNTEAKEIYNSGVEFFRSEKYGKAIAAFKSAIALDPAYTDAMDNLAVCFRRVGQLDSAIFYYEKSLKYLPMNKTALNNLGLVYGQKEDYRSAINVYQRILAIDTLDANGYFGLSQSYLNISELDSTIENGLKAFEIWQSSKKVVYAGDALFYVGYAYLGKNDADNGTKYLYASAKLGNKMAVDILNKMMRK